MKLLVTMTLFTYILQEIYKTILIWTRTTVGLPRRNGDEGGPGDNQPGTVEFVGTKACRDGGTLMLGDAIEERRSRPWCWGS